MAKIENEGVHLLSLSEILQVKTHLDKNSFDNERDVNFEMINEVFESEKNKLVQEIFELRDLLSKISKTNDSDWNSKLLSSIASIFQRQKECILAELRTFVISKAFLDQDKQVSLLETKIDNQVMFKIL